MEHLTAGSQPGLDDLIRQVQDLNQRVLNLERRFALEAAPEETVPPAAAESPASPAPAPSIEEETTRLVPIIGKALLAVAGAYLLRALAEARVLRLELCVAAGIVYALFWLVLAARTSSEQKLIAAVHGLTSVMVLAPLLWEATVRFRAIPTAVSASVLCLFSIFGLAIAWKRMVNVVAWITTLAGLLTAFALLMATRDLMPFTFALLVMAAAVELSACCEHWLRERWIVALFADAAVLLMTFVASRPGGAPESYVPIPMFAALGAQAALLVVYLASIIVRTVVRAITFTTFETAQCVLAFLLCLGGAVTIAHGHVLAFTSVSVFCLVCGAACYLVSFVFLERHGRHDRNFYTYSAFGLLLITGGSRLLLSPAPLTVLWAALALGCLYIGGRTRRTTLDAHGAVYLLLAASWSGWLLWPARILLESASRGEPLTLAQWIGWACAVPAYLLILLRGPARSDWQDRTLAFGVAAFAVWTLVGSAAGLLHMVCEGGPGDTLLAAFCPTSLTAVLTIASMALAWARWRFHRPELSWIVYPLMALALYKLFFVDFRGSHTLPLFVSLLFFGGSLILLPRMLQRRARAI